MNAEAFRYLYDYHFAENRKTWDQYVAPLTQEEYTRPFGYSHDSVRNQLVHLMNAEQIWFSELAGIHLEQVPEPSEFDDRSKLRAQWDAVEREMRAYLSVLRDEMLFQKPIMEPEDDRGLIVWQVLLHVVNHATDHRAQLLRFLNDLDARTGAQDFIFYVYDHP